MKFEACDSLAHMSSKGYSTLALCVSFVTDTRSTIIQVEKSFLQNEGGYRDGLKHQKGKNKGSLHSSDTQINMTLSLYLCMIVLPY